MKTRLRQTPERKRFGARCEDKTHEQEREIWGPGQVKVSPTRALWHRAQPSPPSCQQSVPHQRSDQRRTILESNASSAPAAALVGACARAAARPLQPSCGRGTKRRWPRPALAEASGPLLEEPGGGAELSLVRSLLRALVALSASLTQLHGLPIAIRAWSHRTPRPRFSLPRCSAAPAAPVAPRLPMLRRLPPPPPRLPAPASRRGQELEGEPGSRCRRPRS